MYGWGGYSRCLMSPLILSLCGVVHEHLLPCCVVVSWMDCIVYMDYMYPAIVPLLTDISCLLFLFRPPWSRLLMPGVFKPSCSNIFTLFLHLVSVYWPFQLYFIPKTLHDTCFQLPSYSLFLPNRPFSCISIYNTTLLYIVLALCGHLQTQRVCRVLHPGAGKDGILVAEVPCGVQHTSLARTSPRRVVGLARPNQSAGLALP